MGFLCDLHLTHDISGVWGLGVAWDVNYGSGQSQATVTMGWVRQGNLPEAQV